jgi:hypothetical protein
MRTQAVRPFKTLSFVIFLFTVFFLAFFDNSKHIPFLAAINPFADDPYDAVGSFGIQLSFFAAFLSLIRSFRPYITKEIPSNQQLLILRGEVVALLSVVVTLTADLVALLRYLSMWKNSSAGWILAGLIGGLILLTTLVGLQLYRTAIHSTVSVTNRSWRRAILFPVSIFILAVYPTDLLDSIPGGIFTAGIGMIILFISTWGLATSIFPPDEMKYEDVFHDLASIYREVKSRIKFLSRLENFAKIGWVYRLFHWLNPRQHKWNFIILIALIMGGSLMLIEAFSEGISTSPNMVLLILGIFLGIEGTAVVLGYLLFAEFLGIFRMKS